MVYYDKEELNRISQVTTKRFTLPSFEEGEEPRWSKKELTKSDQRRLYLLTGNKAYLPSFFENGQVPSELEHSTDQNEIYKIIMANSKIDLSDFISTTNDALKELVDRTGMPVTQENGQRKFGPPKDYVGPEPGKGCEIFIGKLPRDCYEVDIVPIAEKIGKIYQIRLMMDFSGTNRGYCFVKFYNVEDAERAVVELDNYEIRKGRTIGVLLSVDNCRLFLGGIPKEKTESEILAEIRRITGGVRSVICYPSIADKTKNRGFAFVEYDCHKSAAMARRKMLPKRLAMWGSVYPLCDWAEPTPQVDSSIMEKVSNLYVRNLLLSTTEDYLLELFNKYSKNGVERVKKIKDYAFVHFASREQAELAKNTLDQTKIEGTKVEISWAKPVDKEIYKAKKALSRSLNASRGNGFGRNQLFGIYSPGMNHYANNLPFPIPIHDNGPMISGMSGYEQQVAALEASFASRQRANFGRNHLFGIYGPGMNNYSNNTPFPIPIHDNGPMLPGISGYEHHIQALEASLASRQRGNGYGRNQLFYAPGMNHYSNNMSFPIPIHDNGPMI